MRPSDVAFAVAVAVSLLGAVVELVGSPSVGAALGVSFWLMTGASAVGLLLARSREDRERVTLWLSAAWSLRGLVLVGFGTAALVGGTDERHRAFEAVALGAWTITFFGALPMAARAAMAGRRLPDRLARTLEALPREKDGRQRVTLVLRGGERVPGMVYDGALVQPRDLDPGSVQDILPGG